MPPVKKLLAAERARRRTGVQHAHGREEESNECDGEWLSFRLLSANVSSAELCCSAAMALNFTLCRHLLSVRRQQQHARPQHALEQLQRAHKLPTKARQSRCAARLQGTAACQQIGPGRVSPDAAASVNFLCQIPCKPATLFSISAIRHPACQPPSLSAWKYYLAEPLPLCHRSWRTSPAAIVSEPQPPSPSAAQSGAAQPGPSSSSPRSSPGDTASQPRDCHLQPLVLIHIGYEKLSPSRRPPAALATASDHPAPAPAATPPAGPAVIASGPSAGRDITHALTSPATATHIHAFYNNTASGSSPPSSASPHGTAPFSTPLAFPAPSSSALPTPPPQASTPPSSTYTPPSSARRPSHAHSWSPTWPSDFPPFCTDSPSSVPCQCPCHLYAVNLFLEVVLFVSERVRGEGVVGAETTREGQSNENAHGSANEGRRRLPEADLNTLLQELGVGRMSRLHHIFDGNGWTLIRSAARQGNTPVLEALVGVGMSIGELGKDTLTTPMHLAALGGHVESMQLLRSHGADIRAPTRKCSCIASNNPALPFIVVPTASLHSLPCFLAYCLPPLSSLLPRLLSLSTLLPASSPTVSLHSPPCFLAYCLSPLSSLLPRLLSLSTLLPTSSPTVSLHSPPCFLAYCLPPLSSLLPRLLSPSTLLPASSPSGTLLHHAAKEQQWDAVRWLAQQGIKPEEVERPGANPKADKLPAHLMAQAVQIVQEVYELEVLLTECIVENGNSMGGHATAAGS
ncbi:unnamed protein product [Closterium sp. NIES-64]|nr:unnamed protein product [Closterium sp. NIES-64]